MKRRLAQVTILLSSVLVPVAAALAGVPVWDSRTGLLGGSTADGNAQDRLRSTFGQFAEWSSWVEIAGASALAVALASLLAYHPRAARHRDRIAALEERKTLVILGLIGAVVAGLVQLNPAIALVIFGIGGLLRFRTLLESPQLTGRAILVVVIGLAAGLGQFVAAIVVASIGWFVVWWLHSHRFVRIKLRLATAADPDRARAAVSEALARMHCKVDSVKPAKSGRSLTLAVKVPSTVADELLEKGLHATLPAELGVVGVEIAAE